MTSLPHILKENLEETVRDICSVSVAPASKSKVREIITSLIIKAAENEIERLKEVKKKSDSSTYLYEVGQSRAIQDQIDYWQNVKEEIIRNK